MIRHAFIRGGENMGNIQNKSSSLEKAQQRLEESNHVILCFTLLYYFVLLTAVLVQYLWFEKTRWGFGLFWGLIVVLLCQVLLFFKLRHGTGYGWMSTTLFSILFTYMNGTTQYSMVLLLMLPMITWGLLYMDRRILQVMDCVWIVNGVLRAIWLANQPNLEEREYSILGFVIIICILFGISAGMVNVAVSHFYETVCHDLSKNNRIHKQLYKRSTFDTTTNLMNRNAYNEYLQEYDAKQLKSVCCVYIDVNGLHEYNNTYGHMAGDKMLNVVAEEMKNCFKGHKQYRIGGDEFVIICQDATFKEVLYNLKEFRSRMKKHGIHIATGMEWRDEDMDIDEMIREADAKMYQDKERFYQAYPEGREGAILYDAAVK